MASAASHANKSPAMGDQYVHFLSFDKHLGEPWHVRYVIRAVVKVLFSPCAKELLFRQRCLNSLTTLVSLSVLALEIFIEDLC
jgi:hypothetical protein